MLQKSIVHMCPISHATGFVSVSIMFLKWGAYLGFLMGLFPFFVYQNLKLKTRLFHSTDAPHDNEDIGTQIAKIKWVEVNKDSFSFFHCPTVLDETDEPDSKSSKRSLFPRHHLITIPFDFFADKGRLCKKDCTLTLPISSSKLNGSELCKLLVCPGKSGGESLDLANKNASNDTNLLPSSIKIFIKRSEYAKFESTVTANRQRLNISIQERDDCSSAFSNLETTMSRTTRRQDTKGSRKRVKLSTKLNPEQMLDAARRIRESVLSEDDASQCLSRRDDGTLYSQQKSKVYSQSFHLSTPVSLEKIQERKNHSQIHNLSTPSPKSSMPMEVMFHNKSHKRDSSKQNPNTSSRSAAEITPLQQSNSNALANPSRLSYNFRRPLETLSAALGTFDHSEMKNKSFDDFVNHSLVQETADSVITFEQTMAKASKIMNELAVDHQRMMENMKGGPNEIKISKMTDWIQPTADVIQRSGEDWAQLRQSYEHDIAKKLWYQKESSRGQEE